MKGEPITMILSNLTWYKADEVLPDEYPEDMSLDEWDRTKHTYFVISKRGHFYCTDWFNGWCCNPGFTADVGVWDDIVLWAEAPDGKELLKSIPKEA